MVNNKEEVKEILHKAFIAYIDSFPDSEFFTEEQLNIFTANKIISKALDKQEKIEWLVGKYMVECPDPWDILKEIIIVVSD